MEEIRARLHQFLHPRRVEIDGVLTGYAADAALLDELLAIGLQAGRRVSELNRAGAAATSALQEAFAFWAEWVGAVDLCGRRVRGEAMVLGAEPPAMQAGGSRRMLDLLIHLLPLSQHAGAEMLEANQRALAGWLLAYGGTVEKAACRARAADAPASLRRIIESALAEVRAVEAAAEERSHVAERRAREV
jgi:hypothetical protein